jgi:hypothetical protein
VAEVVMILTAMWPVDGPPEWTRHVAQPPFDELVGER